MRNRSSVSAAVLGGALIVFVGAVYFPDVGRGFLRDDFGWIEQGQLALAQPSRVALPQTPGFYRPLIAYSFGVDFLVNKVTPRGYGLSNLVLYLACVAALWQLSRQLRMSTTGAAIAAFVWAINPHGINMALLWISGRTALWLTLSSLLAAMALVARRYLLVAICLTLALASKEEAILLPVILLGWHFLIRDDETAATPRTAAFAAAAVAVPAIAWLIVRSRTAAFTPASAPPFYKFTFAPDVLVINALSYLDRSATIAVVVVLVAAAVLRARPVLDVARRRVLVACAIWFAFALAITVFLPVRSSLYAVLPSIGAAIACGVIVDAMIARADTSVPRVLPLAGVLAVLVIVAIPVYRARNERWIAPAKFSSHALETIADGMSGAAPSTAVVLRDVDDVRASFRSAFGTLAPSAVRLQTGRDVRVWIEPPPPDWQLAGLTPPDQGQPRVAFAVVRGRVAKIGS